MRSIIKSITIFLLSFSVYASDEHTNNNNNSISGAGRYYVGADGACDFTSIQAAIDATVGNANAPEVLIATNMTYQENLVINGTHMFLDGSYSTCLNARNNVHSGGRAILEGTASSLPIIRIQGNTGSSSQYLVTINSLQLQNNSSGGIRTLLTSTFLKLENMFFSQLGGSAIYVQGRTASATTDVEIKNSTLLLNSSTGDGGAIRCEGTNNLITLLDTGISGNSATGDGGGVYLGEACDLTMVEGGYENNTTDGKGGAIYAEFGSNIILEDTIFSSNTAGDYGGAIYAADGGTTINAVATKFRNNQSDNFGGAIALLDQASFSIESTFAGCTNRCNIFDSNKGLGGGAIYNDNSNIDVSSAYFEDNRAQIGTAIYTIGASSISKIEGSIFNHNGANGADNYQDKYVVRVVNDANMVISYSTFADNNAETATFGVLNNSSLDFLSSIVFDASSGDVLDIGSGSIFDKHCIIVHETDSFDVNTDVVTAQDPVFVDPANRDYHLDAALSPAVDYCTDTQALAMHKDVDFEDRGYDDVLIQNNTATNGTYDIGADETQGSDIIFKHGFE